MKVQPNRREFLKTTAAAGASLAFADGLFAAPTKKSVLVFTKSSGWEHDVVKLADGKPNSSIMDKAILESLVSEGIMRPYTERSPPWLRVPGRIST